MHRFDPRGLLTLVFVAAISLAQPAHAQGDAAAPYLRDRGTGLPTSMFGTYVRAGEFLVYPFFEYYLDDDYEYKPEELGFGLEEDFRGKFRASEGLLFFAYGISDWLAVELEAAVITAKLEKAADDPSSMPAKLEESGTGDVEGQIRARLARETASRPEFFSFFEAVSPQQKDKPLIGTPDWELKLGAGAIKGYDWGTMTFRASAEYALDDGVVDVGEYAIEYLKRLSPAWRVYAGVEGVQDEVELITEAQWHLGDRIYLKLNNALGLTSKATDWAPEVGVMFSFGTSR